MGTGDNTEIGRISELISSAEVLATPLTRKIAHFSGILLFVILGMAAVTFLVGVIRGESLLHMFMAAVALAVGAIPEGLPAAVTITLAIGVGKMAKRHAIIRKLPAVETLGSTTVICSDKTGTLTQNQMTVREVFAGGELFAVSGVGYAPEGEFSCDGETVDACQRPILIECLKAGLLCNDSALAQTEEGWQAEGDPTEAALIVSARKAGLSPETMKQRASAAGRHPIRVAASVHGDVAQDGAGRLSGGLSERLGRKHSSALRPTCLAMPKVAWRWTLTQCIVVSRNWHLTAYECWRWLVPNFRLGQRRSSIRTWRAD